MNQIINDSAEFVMYEWWPVEIYDPEIEDYDDSAMIKEITRGFSRSILFAIEFIREIYWVELKQLLPLQAGSGLMRMSGQFGPDFHGLLCLLQRL